jgi:hypothetical protein
MPLELVPNQIDDGTHAFRDKPVLGIANVKPSISCLAASQHASSEPTTTPALNRISLQRDVFTDDDHKTLDAKILNVFSAFRKFNEEPHLPSLLVNITAADKRLVALDPDEAEELLDRGPSIARMLRNGWQTGSFKEVRQLGAFSICDTSIFN